MLYFSSMKFTAVYEPAPEGGYVAWLEEMPGVQTQGETLAEAKANLHDAFNLSLEYLRDKARKNKSPESVREPFEIAAS
jgi:predicted RNase H-like HicB family nuclease